MKIDGKVVIVTGASGGIGLATARLLGSRGAKVVLAARNEGALHAAEAKIPGSLAVRSDLREAGDIRALVERTVEHFGRVDCLVNNAGQDFNAPVEEIDPDDYRSILELNLIGALETMQAVIPHMRRQGEGAIVNVSSGTTKMILTGSAGYSSSKAALNHLSLVAREELAPDGIAVSLIYPYITATDLERTTIYFSHYLFASTTAHTTAMLPVVFALGLAIPGMPLPQLAVLLGMSLGVMGIITPYATGPSPVYYGSGYLPPADYWRLGTIFGLVYFAALALIAVPWVLWGPVVLTAVK